MLRLAFIFFFVFHLYSRQCAANDTIKLKETIALEKIGREYAPGYLLIDYKYFQVGYAQNNGFFNYLSYPKDKFSQVYFRNSNFGVYQLNEENLSPPGNSGFFILDSCKVDHLPIYNVTGDIRIYGSRMKGLTVENTQNLRLTLGNDTAINFLVINNNRNLRFQMDNCAFKDSGRSSINNTTLTQFSFGYDKRSGCNISFSNDTINGFVSSVVTEDQIELNTYRQPYKHQNVFSFYKCYIDADFTFFEQLPNSTFIFDKCTFGPNVYLADMAVDKLVIRNCINISDQLSIGFREINHEVELGLTNSNLANIRFDFTKNMRLVFDSSHSKDAITNGYKSLLEKFEQEGKDGSYRHLDLQYRKYKDSWFFHFIDAIWWYHGYIPGLVFAWTVGLLVVFFMINLVQWRQVYKTYPIVDWQKGDYYNRQNEKRRLYFTVLLYTIFVFFSLRVSFDKLKFDRLSFVYLFLFQYLAGLWCLIFIVRFVIRLA